MRVGKILGLLAATSSLAGLPAHAALTISTAATANVKCKQGMYAMVCTASATDAVLNVKKLENLIAVQNVNVETGTAADDIVIAAPVSWASASGLGLVAQGSVVVNAPVSDAGSGTVLDIEMGSTGALSFGAKGSIGFLDTSSLLVIDTQGYQLVKDIASLATYVGNNPAGYYALAGNYDATPDGTYTQAPVQSYLTGIFEGLGNTISNLSISDAGDNDWVGLFREVYNGGTVQNLKLANANVSAGGSNAQVGGLVGNLFDGNLLRDCVAGKVSATGLGVAGGLLGSSESQGQTLTPTIETSCSTATVSSGYIGGGLTGGFVGEIRNSNASGKVSGGASAFVGGLIGEVGNNATIQNSHASGKVSGGSGASVGGLAGRGTYDCSTTDTYATGAVSAGANSKIGGLIGENLYCVIDTSYASGPVTGTKKVDIGGLVGANSGNIQNAYAVGAVSASSGNNGGLLGLNAYNQFFPSLSIQSVYASGAVSGGLDGGLIGSDTTSAGSLKHSYWDTTTSGIANAGQGAGSPANDPGIAPKSNGQLKAGLPNGFSASIWGQKSTVNSGLPYLLAIPPG